MNTSSSPNRRSITQSPWYWVYLFCTAGLIALLLMGPKLAARKAQIESKSQARQQVARQVAGGETGQVTADDGSSSPFWPLYTVLGGLLLIAWYQLLRGRRRPGPAVTAAAAGEESAP